MSGRILPDFDYSPMSVHHKQIVNPYDSSEFVGHENIPDALAPNLAVIEELEEIRDMIESKSRDLLHKEILLSQSMDQIQLHKFELMDSIEHEGNKMLVVAEKKLNAKFGTGVQQLQQLISRVEARIDELKELQTQKSLDDGFDTTTPPMRGESSSFENIDILDIFSSSHPSVRTQLVAASFLVVLGNAIGRSGERFVLRSSVTYLRDLIDDRFHELFETSLRVDVGEAEKGSIEAAHSKFQQAQRGILLRRINVPESLSSQPIEIHVHERNNKNKSPGGKISLSHEARKHSKIGTAWAELNKQVNGDLKDVFLMNPLSPFEECQETQIVHAALNTRIKSRGFMFRLAMLMYTPVVSDNDVQSLSKALNADTVSVSERFAAFQVGMYLLEWKRGIDNCRLSETVVVRMIENALSHTSKDYEALVQLVSNWKQGVWNMLRVCVCVQTAPTEERMFYMRMLDSLYPRELIAAWTPTIITRIERSLIHEKLVGRIKSLIQSRPG